MAPQVRRELGGCRPDRLVELHQGTLGISSARGKGTTATLHFPANRVVATELAGTAAEYVTEESRDVVPRTELDAFHDDVDVLRDDVDRAAARIDRLRARVGSAG